MSRHPKTGNAAVLLAFLTTVLTGVCTARELPVEGVLRLRVNFNQGSPSMGVTLDRPDSTEGSGSRPSDTPELAIEELRIRPEPTALPPSFSTSRESVDSAAATSSVALSPRARQQMDRLVEFARRSNFGASGGRCFSAVWGYLTRAGYGKLNDWNDAPDMNSTYAKDFALYMNRGNNAARWGLRRLPIENPYDAPRGAIVVVAPGSPGTSDPVAGDIAVAAGNGRFINDGPNMSYGSPASFRSAGGRVLGVYVPAN